MKCDKLNRPWCFLSGSTNCHVYMFILWEMFMQCFFLMVSVVYEICWLWRCHFLLFIYACVLIVLQSLIMNECCTLDFPHICVFLFLTQILLSATNRPCKCCYQWKYIYFGVIVVSSLDVSGCWSMIKSHDNKYCQFSEFHFSVFLIYCSHKAVRSASVVSTVTVTFFLLWLAPLRCILCYISAISWAGVCFVGLFTALCIVSLMKYKNTLLDSLYWCDIFSSSPKISHQ